MIIGNQTLFEARVLSYEQVCKSLYKIFLEHLSIKRSCPSSPRVEEKEDGLNHIRIKSSSTVI